MKSLIEIQQYRKCIIAFMVGIICTTVGFMVYVTDPVKTVLDYNLKMAPNSYMFSLWKKPPIDVFVYVYIFNITNSETFLNGDEKLKLEEIGPFVYQEFLENTEITWNANGTLSYIPKRTVMYRSDLSIGQTEEVYVSVPNIPLLGISSALHSSSFLVNYPFSHLANFLGKPILNLTVHDYLWGYDDSLVNLAGSVVPNFINFHKLGLLDRMYDEGENLINMNVKESSDIIDEKGRYLSIESINGNKGLSNWGYIEEQGNETRPENKKCNRIAGASEGTVFPRNMDTRAVFRVFRKAFCRPLPIAFVKEVDVHGLQGYQYALPDNFADPPESNSENECYCRESHQCLKRGLLDLTPCYYNIPAAASLPHFLRADPTLSNGIEGLNPDPEKHDTIIILQPTMGIPMYVRSRLQTNLVMKKNQYNPKFAAFDDLVLPLFWTDLIIPGLPDDLMILLKLAINVLPIVQNVLVAVLMVIGAVIICWSLVKTLMIVQEQQQQQETANRERRDSADLRILLGYGPYSAVRILPAIKKITSKTDLFL